MSEGNGHIPPVEKKEPQDIILKITMSKEHGLLVEGPGNGTYFDEMMCIFLLNKAEDHIKMSNAMKHKQEQPVVTKQGRFKGLFRK